MGSYLGERIFRRAIQAIESNFGLGAVEIMPSGANAMKHLQFRFTNFVIQVIF